ncbi:MAG: MFS transporter [Thermoguttaceae bacterium]|jgi:MFS family permease
MKSTPWKSVFRENTSYNALFLSIAMTALGYGLYKGVFDNYLVEAAGMNQFDKGVTEFFRELAGALLVFMLALLYRFSASQIFKIGGVLTLLGMLLQASIPPSKILITIAIFVYSAGEHLQLGMRSVLTMDYAKAKRSGVALGWQNSVVQIGNLAGFLIIIPAFLLADSIKLYRPVFMAAAFFTALSFILALGLRSEAHTDTSGRRFYFRRKFTKYYMLELFYGARKQVFFTFGPYVLVLFYGASAAAISALFAISAVACFLFSPLVGKIIDRIGYKPVMIFDTLILGVVCFFYGFAHHLFPMKVAFYVCCVNYVLDSVISLAAMASNVYVRDCSDDANEMRATISTGVSVNHFITILVAFFGGWVWQKLGIETLFVLSAILGLCNSAFAATIKVPPKNIHEIQEPSGGYSRRQT